jgi:ribosomal protein S18 acetylase RimI-like enzyme
MDGFKITEGKTHHVDQIVRVHLSAFPGFFLSGLGPFFLKVYYRSIIRSKDGISLVLLDLSENVIGICVGSEQSRGFHTRLIKSNLLEYFIAGLTIILVNPGGIIRLIRNLEKKSSSTDSGAYSEVLSIAVNPEYKSMGLGNNLLATFEKVAMNKGARQVSLTTDYYDNDKVKDFYIKCGYTVMATFYAYPKRKMYRFIKKLY